jgi:uncharacterized protein YnzC (UPF0291/DUF896 family)
MLRDRPTEASRVLEAIAGFNHEERFSDWVETLPFPLAMILRSYHALDRTDKDRYERLLHFFEAFTEFCAAIHLSAVWENPGAWQPQRHAIKGVLNQHRLSLERASFGAWRVIVEVMSKRLQSMLTDQEERSLACELYSTADGAVLEVLTSAELMGLLQRVNYMRNRWSGHGGAVTEAEAAERHALLKSDLDRVREMVGTTFLQYELIEPREAEILDGPVFRCRIRRVMGSNPLLEHTVVDLTTPAKTGALYLHNPGHDKALELVPVVQLSDSPQPAGYFYNRRERAELHMVSYQFAAQSDVTSTSEALLALLGEFAPENSNAAEIRK